MSKMMNENLKWIIEENPLALASVNNDGTPHVIAVAYVKVVDDKLIITNNYMRRTIENIKQNPRISIAVWNKDWTGFQISGLAKYYSEGRWLEFVKKIKENEDEPCKGAIVVKVIKVKGLA